MKKNYQLELDNTIRQLVENNITPKLLLHSCCAPCSSYCLEYLSKYFEITIYFYNPNIDEKDEFIKRSEEQIRLINEMNLNNKIDYVIENYDKKEFEDISVGHENDPEGGVRCTNCYELRLRRTCQYALLNNFDYFTTTLSISPYKNSYKLNDIGIKLEEELGIKYLQADFKKKNGYKRSIELSHEYGLYRQDYCGCIYSKRDHEKRLEKKKEEQLSISDNNIAEKDAFLETTSESLNKENIKSKLIESKKNAKEKVKNNKPAVFLLLILLISVFLKPTLSISKKIVEKAILLKTEEIKAEVNELFIYGRNFNIKGSLDAENIEFDNVSLYFYGTEKFYSDLNYDYSNGILTFNTSTIINEGIFLDDFEKGNYNIFLSIKTGDKITYYSLDNKTEYEETNYYTVTKNNSNKKITIKKETIYDTLNIKVEDSKDESYDVIIDPGHGGRDSGACSSGICETNYTLEVANILKTKLENEGLKVYLTRKNEETLSTYGIKSRTGIGYEKKGKFLISLHLNAGPKIDGYEIYTPYNVNYVFANNLKTKIDGLEGITPSKSTFNYVSDGIYTRTMSESDLNNFVKDAIDNNYEKYTVDTTTNYYYMIRETGGYMTGAYVDGRESSRNNPYVKSNVGLESYIIELGYITSEKDRIFIDNNKEQYMETIKEAIVEYLK